MEVDFLYILFLFSFFILHLLLHNVFFNTNSCHFLLPPPCIRKSQSTLPSLALRSCIRRWYSLHFLESHAAYSRSCYSLNTVISPKTSSSMYQNSFLMFRICLYVLPFCCFLVLKYPLLLICLFPPLLCALLHPYLMIRLVCFRSHNFRTKHASR